MKKYETPVLEVIQVNDLNRIMAGSPDPGNDADAKQNVIIFEEFMEEPDTTGIWSNDPWKIQYSLWDEE
jgi:hypothetical protein